MVKKSRGSKTKKRDGSIPPPPTATARPSDKNAAAPSDESKSEYYSNVDVARNLMEFFQNAISDEFPFDLSSVMDLYANGEKSETSLTDLKKLAEKEWVEASSQFAIAHTEDDKELHQSRMDEMVEVMAMPKLFLTFAKRHENPEAWAKIIATNDAIQQYETTTRGSVSSVLADHYGLSASASKAKDTSIDGEVPTPGESKNANIQQQATSETATTDNKNSASKEPSQSDEKQGDPTRFVPSSNSSFEPDLTVNPADYNVENKHEANKLLIKQKTFRKGGEPLEGLAELVATLVKHYNIPAIPEDSDVDVRNQHMLALMNTAALACRTFNINVDANVFSFGVQRSFASFTRSPGATNFLTKVFEKHMSDSKVLSTGNAQKRADWMEIQRKLIQLRARMATSNNFSEPLTPGEKRMLAKDAEKQQQSASGAYDSRYQNENANCYLAHMVEILLCIAPNDEYIQRRTVAELADLFTTACAFVHHKCHESGDKLRASIGAAREFRYDGLILNEIWGNLVQSSYMKTLTQSVRNTENCFLTVPRLLRITTMVTGLPSLWGLSIFWAPEDAPALIKLAEIEERWANSRSYVSYSIGWYIALGKERIINPLTDDQEQSGEQIIAYAIGQPQRARAIRIRPNAKPYRPDRNNNPIFPPHHSSSSTSSTP